MNRKDDTNENPGSGADHGSLSFMEAKWPRLQMARIEAWGRFPCWTMAAKAFVLALVVLTHLVNGPARAEDPAAAARAIGQAGQAAARAIVKDPASAADVPGYAGTNLPERGLSAGDLGDAANRVINDPADPGGQAGRAVIEGTVKRPDAPVKADDPIARRGDGIEGDAHSPLWGADGIASGSVTDCKAGLKRAEAGGHCGSVSWCVGADCGTAASRANTGFVDSAARLNMAIELGGEEFDRQSLRFFRGDRRSCRIQWGGLADCCRNSGALVGVAGCTKEERLLAEERHAGNTHYLGRRCAKRIFGVCIRWKRSWCVFGSKLGRILQEATRGQLGIGWGSCRGFTVDEMERIDFEAVDLSEFTENLTDGSYEPSIELPEAGRTGAVMRERIRGFYTQSE